MKTIDIKYYNRSKEQIEIEKVYGGEWIKAVYHSKIGKMFLPLLISRLISTIYGALQSTSWSRKKISEFLLKFNIPIDEYEKGSHQDLEFAESFKSFNEFFIRKVKLEKRPLVNKAEQMPAFCDARYFGTREISSQIHFPVKGEFLDAKLLIGKDEWAGYFHQGPLLIARLCPVDYHRFHYPDDGKILSSYRIPGLFHSVNPMALKQFPEIFMKNERHVSILETKRFGKLAYIEVGALCVGKIIQSHQGEIFKKGEEKGYFLFGGSTVVLIGEKGKWIPSLDVLENSEKGLETYIQLNDEVASVL